MDDRGKLARSLVSVSRRNILKEFADALVRDWEEQGLFTTCVNCDHWDQVKDICGKFKERPPAKIIVTGCEHHIDEVPF